jgi:anti-sigma regulatory factor (Ser/Thr protein kinase)
MASKPAHNNRNFVIPSTFLGLQEGFAQLNEWLAPSTLTQNTKDRANLIFDEVVTNIIRYAFDDGEEHPIEIKLQSDSEKLTFCFVDGGRPFDPRTVKPPRAPESLETASIGGRGLLLVNKAAKILDYERTAEGQNRLVVELSREEQKS